MAAHMVHASTWSTAPPQIGTPGSSLAISLLPPAWSLQATLRVE